MRNMFDYVFYRIAKRRFKEDGVEGFSGLLGVTFIISLYVFAFYFTLLDIFGVTNRSKLSLIEKGLILALMFVIFLLVKRRYKGRYLALREKWSSETKKEAILWGIIMVFFFFLPLLFKMMLELYINK